MHPSQVRSGEWGGGAVRAGADEAGLRGDDNLCPAGGGAPGVLDHALQGLLLVAADVRQHQRRHHHGGVIIGTVCRTRVGGGVAAARALALLGPLVGGRVARRGGLAQMLQHAAHPAHRRPHLKAVPAVQDRSAGRKKWPAPPGYGGVGVAVWPWGALVPLCFRTGASRRTGSRARTAGVGCRL